ncbi:unnamed protein product, partial [Linum tenue]
RERERERDSVLLGSVWLKNVTWRLRARNRVLANIQCCKGYTNDS